MFFGVAYYPEHWPEENWSADARNIRACNFDGVRMGEFAWCRLEPEEGQFDFSWLDRAIETLGKAGLKIIIGTPTATPPSWLTYHHPEILPIDGNGNQMKPGMRKHYCHSSPVYRRYSERIVERLAEHYKDNPYVFGWQVDNEFGDHDTVRCYCDACRLGFIEWCRGKYSNLEALNQAWGTIFWSQEYTAWEQIDLPYPRRPIGLNPSHLLDYYRFASDQVIEYFRIQERALRRHIAPHQQITTNIIATFWEIDFRELSKTADFISWDCYTVIDAMTPVRYPAGSPPPPVVFPPRGVMISLVHDLMRAFKKKPFWVMETAGQDRLVTYHTLAHGGNGVNLFTWKSPRFGAEQGRGGFEIHGALTKRFYESQQIGQELRMLADEIDKTTYTASVGLLYSFEMGWAYDINHVYPRSTWIDGVGYWRLMEEYYQNFWSRNIAVEPVAVEDDLAQYPVIFVPCLYITNEAISQKLHDYVVQGGTLVVGPDSGVKDWNSVFCLETPPIGILRNLFGCSLKGDGGGIFGGEVTIEMSHSAPFAAGKKFVINTRSTEKVGFFKSTRPLEKLEPEGALVFARYADGEAACTFHAVGKGAAIYLGINPGAEFMAYMIDWLAGEKKFAALMNTPVGVEATQRLGNGQTLVFLINHNFSPVVVTLSHPYLDLISGQVVDGDFSIKGQQVMVLKEVHIEQ